MRLEHLIAHDAVVLSDLHKGRWMRRFLQRSHSLRAGRTASGLVIPLLQLTGPSFRWSGMTRQDTAKLAVIRSGPHQVSAL